MSSRVHKKSVKVIYIAGQGRSGSTILDRMLGQLDNCVSVGELRYIWDRGFSNNELCGCNLDLNDCLFWGEVVDRAFGGRKSLNVEQVQALWRSVDSVRYIPYLIPGFPAAKYVQRLEQYRRIVRNLYLAISEVSGSGVIIDSSKYAWHASLLATIPEIDLHLIHLVRDSRAVSYSWQRKTIRPEIDGAAAFMDTYSPVPSAFAWLYRNILAHFNLLADCPHMRVRYEDFVASPHQALRTILDAFGEESQELAHIAQNQVFLEASHSVAGNPARFKSGVIDLIEDGEWREEMRTWDKLLVTLLTSPLLRTYGYALSW